MNIPVDISEVTLTTERLILRPWRQSDLDDFFEYASVEGVGEMAGWPHHENKEITQMILDNFIEGKKTFAIVLDDKVIGSLGIEKYNEEWFPELKDKRCRAIGYVLSKDYWGKGIMTEAVKEVIRYLFEVEKLDCILCGHFLHNNRSGRVIEKCGFKHHSFQKYTTRMNTIEDTEECILTRQDWIKIKNEERGNN